MLFNHFSQQFVFFCYAFFVEFEGKCPAEEQPAPLANLDVADSKNVTDSVFQVFTVVCLL